MNLPRQGKPTTIIIEGGDLEDRDAIERRIIRPLENNGDQTTLYRNENSTTIRHYPRAVND